MRNAFFSIFQTHFPDFRLSECVTSNGYVEKTGAYTMLAQPHHALTWLPCTTLYRHEQVRPDQLGRGVAQDVTETLKLFMLDAEESCESNRLSHSSLHHIRDIYLEKGDCAEAIKWYAIFTSSSSYFGDRATGT